MGGDDEVALGRHAVASEARHQAEKGPEVGFLRQQFDVEQFRGDAAARLPRAAPLEYGPSDGQRIAVPVDGKLADRHHAGALELDALGRDPQVVRRGVAPGPGAAHGAGDLGPDVRGPHHRLDPRV